MTTMLLCPTCGAKDNEPCRTPKGRKKNTVHDTRPFSITAEELDKLARRRLVWNEDTEEMDEVFD